MKRNYLNATITHKDYEQPDDQSCGWADESSDFELNQVLFNRETETLRKLLDAADYAASTGRLKAAISIQLVISRRLIAEREVTNA